MTPDRDDDLAREIRAHLDWKRRSGSRKARTPMLLETRPAGPVTAE